MRHAAHPLVRVVAASVLVAVLAAPGTVRAVEPQPAPPYPSPAPTSRPVPPQRYYYRRPPVVEAPPPLSPVMRAIYAPFYAAGLVVRYGLYYVIVAPLEVFGRTVTYGARGGVEPPPPPPRREAEE
jgi:hypothetical protein